MSGILLLSWRSFSRNLRRYRVLLAAMSAAVAVLVLVLGTTVGMRDALRAKAGRYFAGDVVVLGLAADGRSLIAEPDRVERALAQVGGWDSADADLAVRPARVELRAITRRSTYYDPLNTQLFHAGYYLRQRRAVGVEWAREAPLLAGFDFLSGGVPEAGDRAAVLISATAAETLGAQVGDEIILSIISDRGRSNTAALRVRGIFAEPTFFGFTTYLERRTLNALRETAEDEVNEMGVYLRRAIRDESVAAAAITAALAAEGLPTFEVLRTRESYTAASGESRTERHYGVVTLGAQLEEINELLNALTIVAVVVVAAFLLVVAVGVANTYAMIVFERTIEIGTLRAMGISRRRSVAVFLGEALFLGLGGVILGGGAGVAALAAIGRWLDLSDYGFAAMFLVRGRLVWQLPPEALAVIAGLTVLSSIAGCLHSAIRAGRVQPAVALRHE